MSCVRGKKSQFLNFLSYNKINVIIIYNNYSTKSFTYNSTATLNNTEIIANSIAITPGGSGQKSLTFKTDIIESKTYAISDKGCTDSGGTLSVTGGTNNDGTGTASVASLAEVTITCNFPGTIWNDTADKCRKQITLSSATAIPAGSFATYSFDHASLVAAGKSLANGNDIKVVYAGSTPQTILDRSLKQGSSWNNAATSIVFKSQANIAAGASDYNYYLYYCNPSATAPATNIADSPVPMVYDPAIYTKVNDITWGTKVSKSFSVNSSNEVWVWFVTFTLNNNSVTSDGVTLLNSVARVTINGATSDQVSPAILNSTAFTKTMIMAGRITNVTGIQTINLDIRSENASATTTIKDVRITAMLLPSDADFQYQENNTVQTLNSNSYVDIVTPQLTVTPSSAGDYFIMAVGQFGENGTGISPSLKLVNGVGGAGFEYPEQNNFATLSESANGRSSQDTFFVIRKITFTTLPILFKFKFFADSTLASNNSAVQGLKIFAFRSDAFEAAESNLTISPGDLNESNTLLNSATVKSTLTTALPPNYRDYLILQSQYLYDNDTGIVHQNLGDFRMDTTILASQNHVLSKSWDYQFASACVSSLNTNIIHTFENRYWSNDGIATYSKESSIHALRLKAFAITNGTEQPYTP